MYTVCVCVRAVMRWVSLIPVAQGLLRATTSLDFDAERWSAQCYDKGDHQQPVPEEMATICVGLVYATENFQTTTPPRWMRVLAGRSISSQVAETDIRRLLYFYPGNGRGAGIGTTS